MTAPYTYRSLDLRVRAERDGTYTVEATGPDGERASAPFVLPDTPEFQNLVSRARELDTDRPTLERLGNWLFNALFPMDVLLLYAGARRALADDQGLRLRLHVDAPELATLPWELLYYAPYHLAIDLRTPLVRFLDLPDPPRPLRATPPIRILHLIANPQGTKPLDVNAETRILGEALAPLEQAGHAQIIRQPSATLAHLQDALRRHPQILHFTGHGAFKEGRGYLLLEQADGSRQEVDADLLANLLRGTSVRLVVLNACQTAAADAIDVFRGVAQALVRIGLPAVVANQFAVYDDSGIAFAREMYRALVDGYPVDAAVTEGRRGVMTSLAGLKIDWQGAVDWATPTLFLRAPDGVLWDIEVPAPRPAPAPAPIRIQEAYLLWSTHAFFPAFLENPATVRPPLAALAQADPATLYDLDRDTWRLYDPAADDLHRFIPGLGRILAGDARGWPLPLEPHLSQRGHVPYLIDPIWHIQWVGPVKALANVHTESAVHVHLFPSGMVSILTGIRLRHPEGMTTERLVELVRRVRPGRPNARFLISRRGQEEEADEVGLTRRVQEALSEGLFGQPGQHRRIRRALSNWGLLYVYATNPSLARPQHAQEMARLTTLELADLDVTVVTACERTDRALYAGDWVLVESEHESVAYTPTIARRDNRRRFIWKLAAVIEFAYMEAVLCDYLIGVRARTAELRAFARDLELFHLDIPDRYQTVYRRMGTLLRTEERRRQIAIT